MKDRLLQTAPVQLPPDHQMKTLRRSQSTLIWRVILVAAILAFLALLA